MRTIFAKMTLPAAALTSILLLGAPASADAQAMQQDAGVVVLNESLHELRVYAYAPGGEDADRQLIGWVGHDELEFFSVPEEIKSDGEYRVAVQQFTPQPQLGVSAEANPILSSTVLSPEYGETVRITVSEDMDLSEVVVR